MQESWQGYNLACDQYTKGAATTLLHIKSVAEPLTKVWETKQY